MNYSGQSTAGGDLSTYRVGDRARPVLAFLLHLALHEGGYLWLGVRGWASSDDIRDACRSEEMLDGIERKLSASSWLERDDVRPPGRTSPAWVYRITAAGAQLLAADGEEVSIPAPQPPCAEVSSRSFLLLRGSAAVLAVLQAERAARSSPRCGEAPSGWLTPSAIRQQLSERGTILADDIARLMRMGLAEQMRVPALGGTGVRVMYRVTEAGARVQPLTWREPNRMNSPTALAMAHTHPEAGGPTR